MKMERLEIRNSDKTRDNNQFMSNNKNIKPLYIYIYITNNHSLDLILYVKSIACLFSTQFLTLLP